MGWPVKGVCVAPMNKAQGEMRLSRPREPVLDGWRSGTRARENTWAMLWNGHANY